MQFQIICLTYYVSRVMDLNSKSLAALSSLPSYRKSLQKRYIETHYSFSKPEPFKTLEPFSLAEQKFYLQILEKHDVVQINRITQGALSFRLKNICA